MAYARLRGIVVVERVGYRQNDGSHSHDPCESDKPASPRVTWLSPAVGS
jgi:hypothetical protein